MTEQFFVESVRFNAISERMQQQLTELPFTGEMPISGGSGTELVNYHEVGFHFAGTGCEAAVLDCKWVMLPKEVIAQFTGINYVMDKDGEKILPTPLPGLIDLLS